MASAKKFGTFGGVFTPSILTILGVIMYLRLPSIVGSAGLWTTVGIIIVAHIISIATGLSVASIATDKKVQAGGTYYMISRSLGLPIGGTLGLALFVGLSFSVSLYVIGFSESFLSYWGWEVSKNTIRLAGSITLLAVTAVTLISTALALKAQFFIMGAIVLSLVSIVFGNHGFTPDAPLLESLPTAAPFIVLFGIFFPAVTGFEAGVSMSGDLKDPKKSIPSGTIWAIAVGLIVYLALAAFFSFTVSADQLVNNPNILLDMSLFAPAVIAGIWGATISSALGSILGAPRILQATASDKITPRFFSIGYGKENEPRNALILTFLIAEAGILIGELDVIARIVSMFFITTYGFLNLSCFIESWSSPDFRPDFKIPKTVSLIGGIACFVVMIQLDFVAMIGATVLLGLVFLYLKRKELTLESGDTWEGFWSSLLRTGLQRLAQSDVHERNWRPNILLFSFGTNARDSMMRFGEWLVHKRGLLSNFDLVENPNARRLLPRSAQANEVQGEVNAGVFSRRLECQDAFEAMESIATYYGFSGVEPNTVILGWRRNYKHPEKFSSLLRRFTELDLNLLLLYPHMELGYGAYASIDVWWRGDSNNISLMLALIRFLTSSDEWAQPKIRFVIVNEGDTAYSDSIMSRLDGILETFRVGAQVKVINNIVGRKSIREIIGYESAKTDLTIIGMPNVTGQRAESYLQETSLLLESLGTTLLVKASSYFNTLSLGIDTSFSAPVKNKAELEVDMTLPEIDYPLDETLRWALQHLNESIEAVDGGFLGGSLTTFFSVHHELARSLADSIERGYDHLKRTIDDRNRPKSRRALQRAQSTLVFQAREAFMSFQADQLPEQQKLLEGAILKYRSQMRNLIRNAPEDITVSTVQPGEVDAPRSQRKWLSFAQKPGTRKIQFRKQVETQLLNVSQQSLLNVIGEITSSMHVLLESLQNQVQNASDGMRRIEKALADGAPVKQLITAEKLAALSALEEITEDYLKGEDIARSRLRLASRTNIQSFIKALSANA